VAVLVDQGEPHQLSGVPAEFRGWPTEAVVVGIGTFLTWQLGFDPRGGITTIDWLVTPQQSLLSVTAGAVYHDGLGELEAVRRQLTWYPREVWLWQLACQWRRIAQEEPFPGRAAEAGDPLGCRVLVARLVRDVMRLCLLLERRSAPYPKWLGTAFARLGLTMALDASPRLFHDRPYLVIDADRFTDACLAAMTDRALAALPPIGAIDQFVDSTDVLGYRRHLCREIGRVYDLASTPQQPG
jgi:hypothetical protein